jgi:predicted nucleic acid-binding protein
LPDFICNTSPLQYLHQLGRIEILPALTGGVIIPVSVVGELDAGRAAGWEVPNPRHLPWITIRQPASVRALPLAAGLGRGEAGVMALALEANDPVIILDDGVGRRAAGLLGIRLTGTLGILLDAKKKGLIPAVSPVLDELDRLRFRVSPVTRAAVLKLAGELG